MRSVTRTLFGAAVAATVLVIGGRCVADVQAVAIASPPSATTSVYATLDEPSGAVHPEIYADVSASGRFVVYRSSARNVLPGVVSPVSADQIYLFDRLAGQTTLVSHGTGPNEFGNAGSSDARVSGDGSTVLFKSRATNLGGPATTHPGAYLFDRSSGALQFLGETDVPYWIPNEPLSHDGLWVASRAPQASPSIRRVPGSSTRSHWLRVASRRVGNRIRSAQTGAIWSSPSSVELPLERTRCSSIAKAGSPPWRLRARSWLV